MEVYDFSKRLGMHFKVSLVESDDIVKPIIATKTSRMPYTECHVYGERSDMLIDAIKKYRKDKKTKDLAGTILTYVDFTATRGRSKDSFWKAVMICCIALIEGRKVNLQEITGLYNPSE